MPHQTVTDLIASAPLALGQLRKRCGKSQAEVATTIGTTQSGISRIERQDDHLLSTLVDYVEALGGRLRMIVEHEGGPSEIRIAEERVVADVEVLREFRVIWQHRDSRDLVHVGWLTHTTKGFRFSYSEDARIDDRFRPFPTFPDLNETYESGELFQFFAMRLMSAAETEYSAILKALGLDEGAATPAELLARSPGDSPHDTLQIIPEPTELPDGTLQRTFPVSGVRHANESNPEQISNFIHGLKTGETLTLRPEPGNSTDPKALQLTIGETAVGWVPSHLLDEIHVYLTAGRALRFDVERANGPPAPWHLRLICRLTIAPSPRH